MSNNSWYHEQLANSFIGMIFGRLTIEKVLHKRQGGRIAVRCRCSCGKETTHQLTSIKSGNVKSCGCLNKDGKTHSKATKISAKNNSKDWAGQKYNRLIFVSRSDRIDNKYPKRKYWNIRCECGTIKTATASSVVSGHIKSCGCLNQELKRIRGCANRKYDPIISSAMAVWKRECYSDCSFDLFYSLSQKNCHYCGRQPYRTINIANWNGKHYSDNQKRNGNFTYNGLDRIDSSLGHTIDNVVPCCYMCNTMKSDLSLKDFVEHIRRIHAYYCQ